MTAARIWALALSTRLRQFLTPADLDLNSGHAKEGLRTRGLIESYDNPAYPIHERLLWFVRFAFRVKDQSQQSGPFLTNFANLGRNYVLLVPQAQLDDSEAPRVHRIRDKS